ncbi:hypothetical protein GYN67_08080 [Lactococcus piscium]|uniref:hypothetical protein n=1 Tax=Pseudolactococcus carnosus TaxID=2749961 RepID=UPI001FB86AFD|nr:hypothetical protein [Lactococcus carnosus]MCJ1996647.1 hypothetical protein [Lactococcus carnosus]
MSEVSVDIFNIGKNEEHSQEKVGYASLYKEPKNALIEGGKVKFEGNTELDREIEISEKFATSDRIKEIKFCNYIPSDPPSDLRQCCSSLETNLEIVYEKNNVIDFSRSNADRLHKVLDVYSTLPHSEREGRIFKFEAETSNYLGTSSKIMRVYVQIENTPNEKTIYKYIFCDPYHLAIPSEHKGRTSKQVMEDNYRKYSSYNNHIRDIFQTKTPSF